MNTQDKIKSFSDYDLKAYYRNWVEVLESRAMLFADEAATDDVLDHIHFLQVELLNRGLLL